MKTNYKTDFNFLQARSVLCVVAGSVSDTYGSREMEPLPVKSCWSLRVHRTVLHDHKYVSAILAEDSRTSLVYPFGKEH